MKTTQPSRQIVTIAARPAYQTFISTCFSLKHKQSLQWWNRQFMLNPSSAHYRLTLPAHNHTNHPPKDHFPS
ncbi:hypothetical protein H9L39_02486 [Fusarium oxysporum f. sp. albedinis]|nr:hypothetical protein H9L39_02486 [Fusarium oxysporum f. sp. albedinis]